MRSIVVKDGGKTVLENVPTPEPGTGQVRVAVQSAGMNFLDIYQRDGAVRAPFNAGVEGVGKVDRVGRSSDASLIGRRVGWLSGQGSFSDYVVLPEEKVVVIPDDIDDDDALALLMQGLTAHYLAKSAFSINSKSTVLVHSAAGGVGRLLVRIASHLGATVIATASTAEKRRIAVDAGANHAIDYEDFDAVSLDLTNGRGVDAIYDGVGKDTVERDLNALAVRGTLVVIGAASGPPPAVEFSALASKSLTVIRPSIAHFTAQPGELARRADEVFGWARAGVLTTAIAGRYALEDVVKAEQDLTSRSLSGKLIIDVAV